MCRWYPDLGGLSLFPLLLLLERSSYGAIGCIIPSKKKKTEHQFSILSPRRPPHCSHSMESLNAAVSANFWGGMGSSVGEVLSTRIMRHTGHFFSSWELGVKFYYLPREVGRQALLHGKNGFVQLAHTMLFRKRQSRHILTFSNILGISTIIFACSINRIQSHSNVAAILLGSC